MKKRREKELPALYERLVAGQEAKEEEWQCGATPPRGYVPMMVGRDEDEERFFLRTNLLRHPAIIALLDMAAEEIGYQQQGVLRLPCCVEHFQRAVRVASRAM